MLQKLSVEVSRVGHPDVVPDRRVRYHGSTGKQALVTASSLLGLARIRIWTVTTRIKVGEQFAVVDPDRGGFDTHQPALELACGGIDAVRGHAIDIACEVVWAFG